MRSRWSRLVRFSALAAVAGAFSFVVFSSNCGGSGGQRAGTAGNNGISGATGSAGTIGSGGTAGGGTAGVTGTGGRYVCPTDQTLDCSSTGALKLPDGHVTTFDMMEWSATDGKYCNAAGLRGSVFSYSGGPTDPDGGLMSSNAQGVDAPNGNFRLTLTAAPGGYAGGGISFDHCVDVSAFNAFKFSAWIASGDLTGCPFVAELQTFEQRPVTQAPPGSCDPDAGSCYNFPSAPVTLTTQMQTFTIPFSMFMTSATQTNPFPGQLVGLQWQFTSGPPLDPDGGAQPSCTAEIRIDDIGFIKQ
jgi:hypothetical protein